jgi:uncharacterized membrane protein YidH (DUF202 family)
MNNTAEVQKNTKSSHAADHLANERTFLAWIRTCIGIMAFGFVVEKFSIFIKQIAIVLGRSDPQLQPNVPMHGSSIFGVLLVALGALICLLAFVQYKKVQQQIESDAYQPSILLYIMLTLSVLLIGIFLVVYLNNNILTV